ncbi:MAG: aminopeptidase P N-terminal domain-containing protein [Bacteroidales bacterium]|nr:aminopeptidase P N-terminal domain-containing protein [Bacteroidales bacterium]
MKRYPNIDKNLFIKNRAKLIAELKPNSLAVINSNDEMPRNGDQNFSFRQNSDLFYLSGLEQEKCILCLCPNHPNPALHEVVFILKADETMETWNGHKYTPEEVTEISGVKMVKYLDDFDFFFKEMILESNQVYLNQIEYTKYKTEVAYRDIRFTEKVKAEYPLHKLERLAPLLTKMRLIKEAEELELMRKACQITKNGFERVMRNLKPGMMEYAVEAELTYEFNRQGATHAYAPIVAGGMNALVLHYISNHQKCEDGDLLLMDFGAEYANYSADCSRTIPVNGKFTDRQKECYKAVLHVQNEAIKLFVPGNSINIINAAVNKMMEAEMIYLGLFNEDDVKKQKDESPMYFKYLMHGVNHFIGLDVHDVGAKDTVFEKGMILTIEPGLYIKEENIGIRIEDNIMVDDIPINLMQDIPKTVEEIERYMKA